MFEGVNLGYVEGNDSDTQPRRFFEKAARFRRNPLRLADPPPTKACTLLSSLCVGQVLPNGELAFIGAAQAVLEENPALLLGENAISTSRMQDLQAMQQRAERDYRRSRMNW
jgi:hypothetical protein